MKGYRLLAIISFLLLLAGSIIGIILPAGLGWDFANFYDAGQRALYGYLADLYHPDALIRDQEPQGVMRFYSAPLTAYFYVPMSFFKPNTALVLFKIQNTLACFSALLILYFHMRRFIPKTPEEQQKFIGLFLFLSLIFQPFWTIYRIGGQTTSTVLLLLSLGLIFHTSSKFWLSASLLVLAALIKPAFAIILMFLMIVSPLVFFRNATLLLAGFGLLSIALLGVEIHLEFLETLKRGLRERYEWNHNSSLYVPFDNVRVLYQGQISAAANWIFTILQFALKITVVLATIKLIWQSRLQDWSAPAKLHFRFLLSILFFLLISQTLWEHYLAVLFPFLIYLVAWRRQLHRVTIGLLAAIFLFSIGQNIILVKFLLQHFSFDSLSGLLWIGFLKSAPLYLSLFLLLFRSGEFLNTYKQWSENG